MRELLRARVVVTGAGPVVDGGVVETVDGRVASVHSRRVSGAVDLGDVALLPGLVNAHTHLEFSDRDQPLGPARPFTAWLRAVIANRRGRTGSRSEALRAGYEESGAAGVAAIGEIASRGWDAVALFAPVERSQSTLDAERRPDVADEPPAGQGEMRREGRGTRGEKSRSLASSPVVLAFHESLGLRAERIESELALAREHLARVRAHDREGLRAGLSPHAPYSVHPQLVRDLARLAAQQGVPLAMHLAETRAELELLRTGSGEFVEFLNELGVWDPNGIPGGRRVLDYLHDLSPAPRTLVIHGNYLDDEEIDFLGRNRRFSVVYCPRTHAYFGHEPHRWREMLDRGVRVVLGTDSRASNPDLSLWNEVRLLRERHPEVNWETLLRMATQDAAAALGLERDLGTIEPGKQARFAIVAADEWKWFTALEGGVRGS